MANQQQIAIVTGGNRGLGKEVCRQLADKGYLVLLTARSLEKSERAARQLGNSNLVPVQLDVADSASIQALPQYILVKCLNTR